MASFEKELERWSLQDTRGFSKMLQPMASNYTSRLSPVKSISSIDHLMQFQGKVDSAYSSFSGGSTLPDYPVSPLYNVNYCLQPAPLSYMDSEYVGAIYNPSDVNSDLDDLYPLKPVDINRLNSSDNINNANVGGQHGSSSFPDSACKSPSTRPPPLPPLPQPPSPPARLESYKMRRTIEKPKDSTCPGDRLNQSETRTPPGTSTKSFISTCNSKRSSFQDSWKSRQRSEELQVECEVRGSAEESETKEIRPSCTKPLSFILQDAVQSDSVAKTQKPLMAPKAVPDHYSPGQRDSSASHPSHSNHNVNDLPESKQYFYLANFNFHKQTFKGVVRPGAASDSHEQEGKFLSNRQHSLPEKYSEQDESIPQGIGSLKFANRLHQWELANNGHHQSRRTGGDVQYCSSEEETNKEAQELVQNTASKPNDPSQFVSLDALKSGPSHRGDPDFGSKRLPGKSKQIFYCGPKAEPFAQTSSSFKSDESGWDTPFIPKREVNADAMNNKGQLDTRTSKSHPLCDLTSEKITKEKTPMLFHLASGQHAQLAGIFNFKKTALQQEEPAKVPKRASQSTHVSAMECIDAKREGQPPPKTKNQQQFTEDCIASQDDENVPVSPGTSMDDSYMSDYRERLKIAQNKVLRETSFKRRDLQMSLPVRLKVNPSKRPSIEHFKSFSLTNANENVEFTPLNQTPGNRDSSKDEETKKPLVSRIGGRKRQTKEEKKLYYSEPEKLDQLGVLQDPRPLGKGDSTGTVCSETAGMGFVTSRKIAFENRERARSASSLSKTELKQIQHTALIQYIERKTGQRTAGMQQIPSHKPMQRPSTGRRHSEWSPYSSGIQTTQQTEVSSQTPSSGRSPESSCLRASSYDVSETRTERLSASFPCAEATPSKYQFLVRDTDPSSTATFPSVERRPRSKEPLSAESREWRKSAPPFQISARSSAFAPFSHPCDTHSGTVGAPAALAEGVDLIGHSSARGRGKSLEEIGTSDIVQVSALSQSTDQLHHTRRLDMSPVHGPQHHEPAPTENYESDLMHILEKGPGTLPGQNISEDILGLRGESRTSAFQRYSRTVQHQVVSLNSDSPSSFALSTLRMPQTADGCSGNPDQFLLTRTPVVEDDVFLKDFSSKQEIRPKASPLLHADAAESCSEREEPSLLLSTRLSFLFPPEEEQIAAEGTLSTCVTQYDDVIPEATTEVSQKMLTEHSYEPANVKDLEGTTITQSPKEERGDNPEKCRGSTLADEDDTSVRHPEQPLRTVDAAFSQGSEACDNAMPSFQSTQDQSRTNCESFRGIPEALSQDLSGVEMTKDPPPVKMKSPEDERCEALAQEIIAKDQSLVDILDPGPFRKTAVDLMEGLFPVDLSLLDRTSRKERARTRDYSQKLNRNNESPESAPETTPKPTTSLQKYDFQNPDGEPRSDADDLTSKKVELVSKLRAKLQRLREERELLLSDVEENSSQGTELEAAVKEVCKPNEYDRYMMFIGDLEKVVSLLLCLSMRLARVENARSKINEGTDAEERHSLNERHSLLSRQREDAKDLKDNLDRRQKVVSGILAKYLSEQQLQDYQLFVKLKTSLLVEQKDLDEKIRFHEEQMERLQDSIPG